MFDYIDRWERSVIAADPISVKNAEDAYENAVKYSNLSIPTSYEERLKAYDPNEPINFNFEVVDSPLLDKKLKIYRNVVDMTLRLDPKEFIPLLSDMWDEMNLPVKLLMSKKSWIFLFIKLHPTFLADHWLVPIRVDSFYRDDIYNITQIEFMRCHGMDGKSLFINTIRKGFNNLGGEGFAREMPSDAVTIENNTQNGLLDCMDARLITSSDIHKVTEFINSQTIKNITGGDVVTAQVKYRNPVSKSMAGTKIVVCTNYVTYMSDTFVESRVSPVCFFHIRKPGEPDWDQHKVSSMMVEEFNDFVRWCFEFAYAVECERGIPHDGDQPLWCDGTFESVRDMWNSIGSSNDEDGMFRYRMADANSEILEEDIEGYIDDIFYKTSAKIDDSVKVCDVRAVIGNVLNIKFRDAGADKRWNLVSRIIQKHFEVDPPKLSNGIRRFFGIGFKKGVEGLNKKSSRPSNGVVIDTGMPC